MNEKKTSVKKSLYIKEISNCFILNPKDEKSNYIIVNEEDIDMFGIAFSKKEAKKIIKEYKDEEIK